MTDPRAAVERVIDRSHPSLIESSHLIHARPEIAFEEVFASGLLGDRLESSGFEVQRGLAGMPTAVSGTAGPGPLHVVLVCEYDALPVVGHACGHNVICATGLGAGVGLLAVANELGLRVTVMGTPAEEGGGGKIRLIEAGAFEGVHAAMMVHPAPRDTLAPWILAAQTLEVAYTGREAHAAGAPEKGINAADAFVVAQVSIGLLRQHLPGSTRVHGIVTHGGDAPNIIPASTSGQFMIRAADTESLAGLRERVLACFEAGALATGARLAVEPRVRYAHLVQDADLLAAYGRNAVALGRLLYPRDESELGPVSTDMGDVSHVVPSIHPMIGIDSLPSVNHQPGFTAAAASSAADQAIRDGALAMAWTVIDAATDEGIRARLLGGAT